MLNITQVSSLVIKYANKRKLMYKNRKTGA